MNGWNVGSVVQALGINGVPKSDGGNVIGYKVGHADPNMKDGQGRPVPKNDQTYTVNGKKYRVSVFTDYTKRDQY